MATREITVRLRAQTTDFKREMTKAQESLDKLVKASGDKSGVSQTAMGRLVQSARLQADSWTSVGSSLTKTGAAMTALTAAVGATGVAYNTLQQQSRAALKTLLGSAEAAAKQMDKLDEFARTSPFAKQTFITAQQQMLAFGIETQKVIPYLDAIGDAVAASGGTSNTVGELAFIFSQIQSSAKITAQELREFGDRGVDAAKLIGDQMGMTAAEVRDSITRGTLDAGDALDALAAGMKETFGGASANVKDTMVGALDHVKAAWRDLSSAIMSGAVGPEGGGWLVDMTNGLADMLRVLESMPTPALETMGALSGIAGISLLGAGGLVASVPKFVELHAAFKNLEAISPRLARGVTRLVKEFSAFGIAVTAATAIYGYYAQKQAETEAYVNSLSDAIREQNGLHSKTVQEVVADRAIDTGIIESAKKYGIAQSDIVSALLGVEGAERRVQSAVEAKLQGQRDEIENLREQGKALGSHAEMLQVNENVAAKFRGELSELSGEVQTAVAQAEEREQLSQDVAAAMGEETAAVEESALVWQEWSLAARMGANASDEAAQAYAELVGGIAEGAAAFIDLAGAFDAATQKQEEFGLSASQTTEEYLAELQRQVEAQQQWRENLITLASSLPEEMLAELAAQGPEVADLLAMYVSMSPEQLGQVIEAWRQGGAGAQTAFAEGVADLPAVLAALGQVAGADAVKKAQDELRKGKTTVEQIVRDYDLEMEIRANTDPAIAQARWAINRISGMSATVQVGAMHKAGFAAHQAAGGPAGAGAWRSVASGTAFQRLGYGRVNGPGTGTSDSIPAMLSAGEWIVPERISSTLGRRFMRDLISGRFRPVGYATGGEAGYWPQRSYAPVVPSPQLRAPAPVASRPATQIANTFHVSAHDPALASRVISERLEAKL